MGAGTSRRRRARAAAAAAPPAPPRHRSAAPGASAPRPASRAPPASAPHAGREVMRAHAAAPGCRVNVLVQCLGCLRRSRCDTQERLWLERNVAIRPLQLAVCFPVSPKPERLVETIACTLTRPLHALHLTLDNKHAPQVTQHVGVTEATSMRSTQRTPAGRRRHTAARRASAQAPAAAGRASSAAGRKARRCGAAGAASTTG